VKHLDFEYVLQEHGWAIATFAIDGRRIVMDHGYCSHPLGDLATIGVLLAAGTGLPRTSAEFDGEPGGHVAFFTHRDPTRFELWQSHDVMKFETAEKELLVKEEIDSIHFATSVGAVLHGLYRQHGLAGFARRWVQYSFPFLQYWHLRLLLDESPLIDEMLAERENAAAELRILECEPRWAAARLDRRTSKIELPTDI
jgi:hypothetical protein